MKFLVQLLVMGSFCYAGDVSFTDTGRCTSMIHWDCDSLVCYSGHTVVSCDADPNCRCCETFLGACISEEAVCSCVADCRLEAVATATSSCNIGTLETKELQASDVMVAVIAGIASSLPYVGFIYSSLYNVYDAQEQNNLYNELVDFITEGLQNVAACIDESISDYEITSTWNEMSGIMATLDLVEGSAGETLFSHLEDAFRDFTSKIPEMFALDSSHRDYKGKLPIFITLYPLYAATAAEYLVYFKYRDNGASTAQNLANLANTLSSVETTFDTLATWIENARAAIYADLQEKIAENEPSQCASDNSIATELSVWNSNFIAKYHDRLEAQRRAVSRAAGGLVQLYSDQWLHCYNLGLCFSGSTSLESAKDFCVGDNACIGFSYSPTVVTGTAGCYKQNLNCVAGGFGSGSHGYYGKFGAPFCYERYVNTWPDCVAGIGQTFSGKSLLEAQKECDNLADCYAFSYSGSSSGTGTGSGQYKTGASCRSSGAGTGSSHDGYCKCGECDGILQANVVSWPAVSEPHAYYYGINQLMLTVVILLVLTILCMVSYIMRKKSDQKYVKVATLQSDEESGM